MSSPELWRTSAIGAMIYIFIFQRSLHYFKVCFWFCIIKKANSNLMTSMESTRTNQLKNFNFDLNL